MPVPYRELRPDGLPSGVACLWERMGAGAEQLIVPDGCVDLIWLAERELVVAGPDTGPRAAWLADGLWSTGIRLRPGAAGSFLGRPAATIRNCQVSAQHLFGPDFDRLSDGLAGATPPERLRLLADLARRRRIVADPLVVAAAHRLAHANTRIAAVADELGVSERQLHRRTVLAVGYAPKVLARVLRLRRLTRTPARTLAERALAAGYASQAHMGDEVRALTGQSAGQYLVRFSEDAASRAG